MGQGENNGYQHFLFLPQRFRKAYVFLILSQTSSGFYVSAVLVFWKHCRKRRHCSLRAISPFPTVFSTCLDDFLPIFHQIWNYRPQTLSVWKSLKFVVWERVGPFPNKPWFLRVCNTSILKTLREEKELLVTSNFSFPTVFSTLLDKFMLSSSNYKFSSANSFSLEESKICCLGKG